MGEHLVKLQKKHYEEKSSLLEDLARKAKAGILGSSSHEMLANTIKELDECSKPLAYYLKQFITGDPAMLKVKAKLRLLYGRAEPVLITGPTGTGKELLAKALSKGGEPFVRENCAAIPEQLVESVFFGHTKGAFTGAISDHVGLLEEAGEGIIFLDEIGDMPLSLQAKFLWAIQENEIRRVGSVETINISCRFVAATKYNLEERVEQRLFREDLYARLFTYPLHVTGLLERPDDIELITKEKTFQMGLKYGEPNEKYGMPKFPEDVIQMIYKYNVRGIEAALARYRAYGSYE